MGKQEFGAIDNLVRDELLLRLHHYRQQIVIVDARLEQLRPQVPELEAILDVPGICLYMALLIIGELGEVERFRTARQVQPFQPLARTWRWKAFTADPQTRRSEESSSRCGRQISGNLLEAARRLAGPHGEFCRLIEIGSSAQVLARATRRYD